MSGQASQANDRYQKIKSQVKQVSKWPSSKDQKSSQATSSRSHQSKSKSYTLSKITQGKLPRDYQVIRSEDKSENKGLASVDRSNKATLLLTAPRSNSSRLQRIHPRAYFISIKSKLRRPFRQRNPAQIWFTAEAYFDTTNTCGTNIIVSSTDSDLEAFSHNLADDSFAPLPDRTGANTNYLNEQFLSYYPQLLLR